MSKPGVPSTSPPPGKYQYTQNQPPTPRTSHTEPKQHYVNATYMGNNVTVPYVTMNSIGAYTQPPTPSMQPVYVNPQGQAIPTQYINESMIGTHDGNTFILNPITPSPSMNAMGGKNKTTPHMVPITMDQGFSSTMSTSSLGGNQFPSTLSLIPMSPSSWQLSMAQPNAINTQTAPLAIPNTSSGNTAPRSELVDPLLKSRAEEAAAVKARAFMRQRYRHIGLVMLLMSMFLLCAICPIVYFVYRQFYQEELAHYHSTHCTILEREVEPVEFHDLCPPTVNYRYYFTVSYDTKNDTIPALPARAVSTASMFSLPDHPALRSLQPLHQRVAALATHTPPIGTIPARRELSYTSHASSSSPVVACTGAQITCYTGATSTGYHCSTCEPNSVTQCYKHVSLYLDDFPTYQPGAEVSCWVHARDGTARVFLENPELVIDYPRMDHYWTIAAAVAAIFLLIALYYLAKGDPCRRQKQRLPRALRPKHAARAAEQAAAQANDPNNSSYQPPALSMGEDGERRGKARDKDRVRGKDKDRTRPRTKTDADQAPVDDTLRVPVPVLVAGPVDLGDGVTFNDGAQSVAIPPQVHVYAPQPQLLPSRSPTQHGSGRRGSSLSLLHDSPHQPPQGDQENAPRSSHLALALSQARGAPSSGRSTPNGHRTPATDGSFEVQPLSLPSRGQVTPLLLGQRMPSDSFSADASGSVTGGEESIVPVSEKKKKEKKVKKPSS